MNKKGFTLIELLAIIVILAIIAVITTPIILGIIDEAKIKSAKNSVYGIEKSAQLHYSKKQLDNSYDPMVNSNILADLEYSGKEFENYLYYGYGVYVNDKGKIAAALKYDDKCYIKDYDSTEIEVKDFNVADCTVSQTERWDGTSEAITPDGDIYYVSNPKQLAWISEQTNSGANSFEGKQVVLINDLNMGAIFDKDGNLLDDDSHVFITIKNFAGNFDGNNHKIYNLYVNKTENSACLFGGYLGTEFKNLIVENSYFNTTGYIAGILGGNSDTSPILNIENVKSINNIIKSNGYIGGIIGQLGNGNITNCYNNSAIIGDGINVAGIVGRFSGTNLENNINDGNVIASSYSVGGIVGNALDSASIKNNINNGNVTGNSYGVGGLVGLFQGINIENNINNGNITGNSYGVGGIVGEESNAISVKNNSNNGIVQGETKWIGGIVGIHDSNTQLSIYSNNINNGEVKTSKGAFRVGGIVGNGNPGIVLLNNINNGNIDGVGDGTYSSIYGAGGIVGSLSNNPTNSYVYNNYNRGNVKSKQNAGGIVGNTYDEMIAGVVIKNSINEGTVEATNGYAGGIIGVYNNNTSTGVASDFITNAYNKGTIKGTNASGLVGRNIGIKNSITVGTLEGTNNYGVIANAPSGVNISNVYYPNTQASNYGTSIDITTLNDTTLRNILGDGFSYNNGSVSLYKADLTIENNEVTNCTYSSEILR